MHNPRSLGLCLLLVGCLGALHARAEGEDAEPRTLAQSFEGRLDGWELVGGASVVGDERGRMLTLSGPGHGVWYAVRAEDFTLRCRYRHAAGAGDVILRGSGEPPRQREAHIRLRSDGVEVLRTDGHDERRLAHGAAALRPGAWYELVIEAAGTRLTVSLGGRTIVTAEDPRLPPAGLIAFGCVEGRGFAYDDVVLERTARVERPAPHEPPPEEVPAPDPAQPEPGPEPETPRRGERGTERLPRVVPVGPVYDPARHRAPPAVPLPVAGVLPLLAWHRTGGPLGGLGYDVRMQRTPLSTSVMYVSDAWAGVFKSTDAGGSWVPSSHGITIKFGATREAVPVFSLTVDPHDPQTLWAGMKDLRGIFKSSDGGAHWKQMDAGVTESSGITFRGFTVHPYDRNTVYAAAEISSWAWTRNRKARSGKLFDCTRGVVYRTTNGGQTWYAVWRGENLARYVWIDPTNPHTLYLSTGIFDREGAQSTKQAHGGIGVFKSTNAGATWKPVNRGLGNRYVGSLFMHPQDPRILLAGTGNNAWEGAAGVYLTLNGGQTWSHVLPTEVVTSVEFSASDPRVAYAGSSRSIFRSADTGRTWKRMTPAFVWGPPGIRAGWPIDFEVDPQDPNRLFANAYGGGNFLSMDGGRTWTDASKGYTGAQLRGLSVDPQDSRVVYAAARSGIFVSRNAGDDWTGLLDSAADTLDWQFLAVDPRDSGHLLAASLWSPGRLVERRRGRRGWQVAAVLNDKTCGWRCVAFAPSNPGRIYVGTCGVAPYGQPEDKLPGRGVYTTPDGGAHWVPAHGGAADAHVHALAIDPLHEGHVYAATTNRGLLETLDGGQSWHARNNGLGQQPVVLSVAIHRRAPHVLLAGLRDGGLRRSTDGGATFKPWLPGLDPTSSITAILFDPARPDVIYVADSESGVYRKDAGGKRWIPIIQNLTNREVRALAISADGRMLYAGTEGAGVFRLALAP